MKFAIITHAEHKVKGTAIYAYEPYVREMNLWLKNVDEVKIVAPVSKEAITSIESSYEFNKRCNDEPSCHPEQACTELSRSIEGSHDLEFKAKSLRQAQTDIKEEQIASSLTRNDETNRHPEFISGSHNSEKERQIPHQVRDDNMERHSEQSEAISSIEQIATSISPRNDNRICHPEQACAELSRSIEGSHDSEHKNQIPNQVGNDEMERHSEQSEAISSIEQIATSISPCLPNRQARNDSIELFEIPAFDITSIKNSFKAILKIPKICYNIYKAMQWADHIHLRCPGNIGLLGCFVQVLFPNKPKTIKYAGNWDPNSKQPFSYKLQKWILSNTFITKNAKVLVYGDWPNQTKNIVPFFTASYSEDELHHPHNEETTCHPEPVEGSHDSELKDKSLRQAQTDICKEQFPHHVHDDEMKRHSEQREAISPNEQIASSLTRNDETTCHSEQACTEFKRSIEESHDLELKDKSLRQAQTDISKDQIPNRVGNDGKINFLFVGALTKGKQPLLSIQVVHELKKKGYQVQLAIYGEGEERKVMEHYITENKLTDEIVLHGNVAKEIIKKAYQNAHFLLFISKSEGWPKVVAEAMFWACLPISSNVSCIPYMLDKGNRGAIVTSYVNEIVLVVEDYLKDNEKYTTQVKKAKEWSRQFTLEKFEEEIGKLI